MNDLIYLDNNATTMIDPEALDAMMPFLKENYGNPSSMYDFGGKVAKNIKTAREQMAGLLGCADEREIVFTSCGTESDNLAIMGTLAHTVKKHIVTTKVEHPAVLNLFKKLESENNYRVTYLPVDKDGILSVEAVREAVRDDTAVVSIMFANNETGVIFPVEDIGNFLKSRGIPFHIDAVQAAGKIPVDVKKINCDLLSVSGHKFHGPKGVGALFVRKGFKIKPLLYGGHQENGLKPGTENVAGIIGMGKAADLAKKHFKDEDNIKILRDKLENGILKQFSNAHLNGSKERRVPNTTNIGFDYIEGESILLYLNDKNIAASSGSACSTGSLEPSHVLRAMDVPFASAHGSVRFSLSRFTTEKEIDYTLSALPEIVEKLLKISPFWDNKTGKGIAMK